MHAALLAVQLVKLGSDRQHLWRFSADLASCLPYTASIIVSIKIASLSDSDTLSTKPKSWLMSLRRRMDNIIKDNERLRTCAQELQTCLENGNRVIAELKSSRGEAEK